MNKIRNRKNNKGFSLVELIIVIAIMAVLVVVLAPQYLKYVERSRNSTDASNATSMVTACQVWAADPNAGDANAAGTATTAFKDGDEFVITVTKTEGKITGAGAAAATSALDEAAIKVAETKCKSKTAWDTYTISGKVNKDGSITFTYGSSVDGTANDNFKNTMTK